MHEPKEVNGLQKISQKVRADELPGADIWCFRVPLPRYQHRRKAKRDSGDIVQVCFSQLQGLLENSKKKISLQSYLLRTLKNLLSVNRGYDFLKLLIELDEIGYDAEWDILNSKHFGVPQNRERLFIVGNLRGRSRRKIFPIGVKFVQSQKG